MEPTLKRIFWNTRDLGSQPLGINVDEGLWGYSDFRSFPSPIGEISGNFPRTGPRGGKI
jgi:hypothetical protein